MPKTVNAIPSRQRADQLIESTTNLGVGATFSSDTRQVDGYGGLNIYGFSNESFLVRIQEALSADGPFNETDRETSAINEAGTFQQVCRRFVPCGDFVRVFVDNLGAGTTTTFQFQVLGLPVGDSSVAIIAGGGGFVPAVRDADADNDFAASLLGWVTNSRMAVLGAADYERLTGRPFDDGAIDETLFGMLTRAAVTGLNQDLGAGAQNVPIEARAIAGIDGTTTLTNQVLLTAAIATGIDSGGVNVLRPIEARNFDAAGDVAEVLVGLLCNTRNSVRRIAVSDWAFAGGDTPAAVSGASPGGLIAAYTNALVAGQDNTAAAVLRPVEARNLSADGDVVSTLIGLLVNSRITALDVSGGDYLRLSAGVGSGVDGRTMVGFTGLYVNSNTAGVDNTGAAVLRPVEARDATSSSALSETRIGLLTNSRIGYADPDTSNWKLAGGISIIDGANHAMGITTEGRASGYLASRFGRRFIVTVPAAVSVTGTTSFVATSPQILLQAAGTNDLVLRSITITLVTAAGADPVRIHGIIDPDARFSSGGTSRTPSNTNTTSVTASSAAQVRDGAIVATAADADERDVFDTVLSNAVGSSTTVDFQDGLIIGILDTLLVYVQGGTSGPTFTYTYEYEDANVQ